MVIIQKLVRALQKENYKYAVVSIKVALLSGRDRRQKKWFVNQKRVHKETKRVTQKERIMCVNIIHIFVKFLVTQAQDAKNAECMEHQRRRKIRLCVTLSTAQLQTLKSEGK